MTQNAPDLPESMTQWPSIAVEFVISLNRIRRESGQADTNEQAARTLRHARTWWSVSTAHQWPERGKRAKALETGVEPALVVMNRHGVRIIHDGQGPAIQIPSATDNPELQAALQALGLAHLPVQQRTPRMGDAA